MKARHFAVYMMIIVCLSFVVACGQTPGQKTNSGSSSSAPWMQSAGSGEVLASVNGINIYMDEYKKRMEKQSPYIRARYNTIEKRKEFLESMVRFELLAQAAIDKGLDKDPDVIRAAKQVMTQKLMQVEFEEKTKREDIPEEQMRTYYDEHKSEYNKAAMRRASHILISIPADANKTLVKAAQKKANKIFKEAKASKNNPNSFRKLAKEYSEDKATKTHGGDVGYFARTEDGGSRLKEFSDAVFKMGKINDISGPIRTKLGFHIVRLTGKRDKIERSYEQVRTQIQHRLFKENRTKMFDDFISQLNKKAKININEKLLDSYNPIGNDKNPLKNNTAGKTKKAKAPKATDKKSDVKKK